MQEMYSLLLVCDLFYTGSVQHHTIYNLQNKTPDGTKVTLLEQK